MHFRFIECEAGPAERFALDEVAMGHAGEAGEGVIVLYRMGRSAISIGRIQAYSDVASTSYGGRTFEVVRRPSSGSSVVHNDEAGDFSYTIALPLAAMPKARLGTPDTQAFRREYSSAPLHRAFASLGIEADILGHNYLMIGGRAGRTLSSNAYAGNREAYRAGMVHGYVNCNGEGKVLWDKLLGSGSSMIAFATEFGVQPAEVYRAVREAFLDMGDAETVAFSGEERETARLLAREVYGAEGWRLHARDPRGIWTVKKTKSLVTCPDLVPQRYPPE